MNEPAASGRNPRTRLLLGVVRFPLTRIILFIAGILAALWLLRLVAGGLSRGLGTWWPGGVANVVLPVLAVHFAYRGITRLLEGRSAAELSLHGALRETGAGALVGAGCLTLTVACIAALGGYHVEGIGAAAAVATGFGIAATSGYIEEVIFRGVVFRIVEEGLGSWLALAVSVALFGLAHLGNPSATLYGAAAIGIEAGVLLGAAYILTRRLWLAIGVHFGWNFMQAAIFGPSVSGRQVESLLQSRLSGPDPVSGGALGVEGSVFAIAICLLASSALLTRAQRRNRFIRPVWRRCG